MLDNKLRTHEYLDRRVAPTMLLFRGWQQPCTPEKHGGQVVISHDTATRPTGHTPSLRKGRATIITLWVTQAVLAAMFIFAGGSKLLGAPAMVDLFNAIGFGQWFRYLTGAIETSAAVMLLIPSAAVFGALLLVPTMIGAVATNLSLGQSPAPPLLLLLFASAVAWARRDQLQSEEAFSS